MGVWKPSTRSAASRPMMNPPFDRVCNPLVRSEIVAYTPSPILCTEANPLSATGPAVARLSATTDSASAGPGSQGAAAQAAPRAEARIRRFRRENDFASLLTASSNQTGSGFAALFYMLEPLAERQTLAAKFDRMNR